jgi:hypothetical protein
MIRDLDWKDASALFVGGKLRRENRQFRLIGLHAMPRFGQFQVFLDGGDFVAEPTTLLFEFVESILVGVDTLFKADQSIGELFQQHAHERA